MITVRQMKAIYRYYSGDAKHLFIHIPKNAGMAIRNSREMRRRVIFADPYFHISRDYTRRLYSTMAAGGHHHGAQHARLIDIHPKVRSQLQPVAIIRNPWKRTVSRFTFQFKYQERAGEKVDYSAASFERFLEERFEFSGREFFWHRAIKGWFSQMDYIRDEKGAVAADVIRQEHLGAEISAYFGVDSLPQRNLSGVGAPHFSSFYTEKTRQIIADWYQDEIDYFGFDFDSSATRNYHFLDRSPA